MSSISEPQARDDELCLRNINSNHETLLYGNLNSTTEANNQIFKAVHSYIQDRNVIKYSYVTLCM